MNELPMGTLSDLPGARLLRSRAGAVLAFLCVLCVVLGTYRSALTRVYGYNDDYLHLYNVRLGRFDPAHSDLAGMGRPLSSFILYALFTACGSVEKLAVIRLLSLLGIVGFVLVLSWMMIRQGFGAGVALTVALLAALSPAGGVCAAWATAVCLP